MKNKVYIAKAEDLLGYVRLAERCRISAKNYISNKEFRVKAILTKDGEGFRYVQVRCTKRTTDTFLKMCNFETNKIELLIDNEWTEFLLGEEPKKDLPHEVCSSVRPANPLLYMREHQNYVWLFGLKDDFFLPGQDVIGESARGPPE